jgi:hypothetical protein
MTQYSLDEPRCLFLALPNCRLLLAYPTAGSAKPKISLARGQKTLLTPVTSLATLQAAAGSHRTPSLRTSVSVRTANKSGVPPLEPSGGAR